MSEKECMQILAIVRSVYPNTKGLDNPNAVVKGWMLELGGYNASAVLKAARLHMATSKFFPTPADIIEKMVRAQLVYVSSEIDQDSLQAGNTKLLEDSDNKTQVATVEYLENLCKFVGLGYPNEIEGE